MGKCFYTVDIFGNPSKILLFKPSDTAFLVYYNVVNTVVAPHFKGDLRIGPIVIKVRNAYSLLHYICEFVYLTQNTLVIQVLIRDEPGSPVLRNKVKLTLRMSTRLPPR